VSLHRTRWALLLGILLPGLAQAAAGSVLFALGRVEIQRGGQTLTAQRGAQVEVGDTITTGPTGLAQLRMKDGGLLSLRSGSSLTVEEFRLPTRAAPAPASAAAPQAVAAAGEGGRSVLRLLRGAFRTVTGLIGKGPDDNYQVRTPAATIGIRGTDYSAALCSGDCGTTPDGLYVGVSNGEIYVANESGELVLADNQYAYVKDTASPPSQEMAPPEVLEMPLGGGEGEDEDEGQAPAPETTASVDTNETARTEDAPAAVDKSGEDTGFTGDADTGATQPEGTYELLPGQPGTFAFGVGPFQSAAKFTGASDSGVYTDDNGALIGFLAADTQRVVFYGIGTAAVLNHGFDSQTGLQWGRWSEGVANVGGSALDLTTTSLHWIYALAPSAPVLPTSGTATFTLIGNTNPTDSAGNTGFLGSATLTANFTNQTVASSLSLGINSQVWQASGSGSLFSGTAVFAGGYSVTVNDAVGSLVGTGSGSFTGFFTDAAAAAGLSYSLTSGGSTVSGAAAFQNGGTP
jgi:hypothetical protein